jgi:hypothetical protein
MGVIAHFPISICPPNALDSIKGTPITLASAQIQCVSVEELAGLMGTDEEHPWSSVGMGVYLMDVHLRPTPHGCVPHSRTSHKYVPHGCVS